MARQFPSKFVLLGLGLGLFLTLGTVGYISSASAVARADSTVETATRPADPQQAEDEHPAGWRTASHSNEVDPNYAVVFPQEQVNTITVTISADRWAAMQADMTELFGEPGSRRQGASSFGGPRTAITATQPVSPLAPPADFARPDNGRPSAGNPPDGGPAFGGGPGFGGGDFTTENPMWVTATLEFAGDTWTNVGIRYKGNSSLRSGWDSKALKLPFKLDFDEFEDAYPAIKNQRFYGFKQLSLANGFGDTTYMRDALAYGLLDEAGLVAAETAFYNVILDYGEGPVNLGIYTMIEVVDDTVIGRYFNEDKGNIYEGDGRGVTLAEGTFDQIETSFQKENNEDEANWSDIEALYTVLHATERITDPKAWRADLEAVFDVDTYLKWLALSAVLQHWDTYGGMTHNFYLYHNPATEQLTWISWDHNLILGGTGGGGIGGGRPAGANDDAPAGANRRLGGMRGPNRSTSLDKADVNANWPLIRYLLDDPTYYAQYVADLEEISDTLFDPAALAKQYQEWETLLTPYVAEESGEATFEAAVQELVDRTYQRADEVRLFLEKSAK